MFVTPQILRYRQGLPQPTSNNKPHARKFHTLYHSEGPNPEEPKEQNTDWQQTPT